MWCHWVELKLSFWELLENISGSLEFPKQDPNSEMMGLRHLDSNLEGGWKSPREEWRTASLIPGIKFSLTSQPPRHQQQPPTTGVWAPVLVRNESQMFLWWHSRPRATRRCSLVWSLSWHQLRHSGMQGYLLGAREQQTCDSTSEHRHVEQIFLPLPAQPQEPLAVPPSLQSDGGNKQMTVPHKLHNCDAWTPRPGHSTIMVITEGHREWILHLFFVHRWGKVVMADRTHNHRLLRKLQERSWPTAPSSRIHCLQHWFLVILCLPRHYTAT